MKFFASITLLFSALCFADCPAPMVGQMKSVVRYIPGEDWSQFEALIGGHLEYIVAQMKNGNLEQAGPFLDKDNNLNGGVGIYKAMDLAALQSLVEQDPVVKAKVVTVEVNSWLACSLPK